MAVSIGTVVGYLRLQDDFTVGLRAAGQELVTFQQKAERIASSLTRIGTALSIGVTAPIVTVGKVSVQAFGEFERRMKVVQAVSETSAEGMRLLENAALTMGRTTLFSAAQSAEALGELAKAGFTATQAAEALPRVLQLATAADLTMADAAVISANAVKTFGLEIRELSTVNDVLAKAAAATTIDVDDLKNSLKYIGPIANTAGLGISETVAALGILGDAGIKASIAGTGLRGTMAAILAPTRRAKDVLHQMGIESFVVDGKFIGLTKTIRLIEDNIGKLGGEAEQTAGLLQIFGRWAGPAISALVDRGASAISAMNVQLDMSGGFAERTAKIMNEGLLMTLRHMRNAVEVAGIALGRVLSPAIAALAVIVGNIADLLATKVIPAFQALPVAVQIAVGAIVGLGLVIPPVLLGLGLLTYAIAAMGEGVTLLSGLLPAWARQALGVAAANTALATSAKASASATAAASAATTAASTATASLGAHTAKASQFGVALAGMATSARQAVPAVQAAGQAVSQASAAFGGVATAAGQIKPTVQAAGQAMLGAASAATTMAATQQRAAQMQQLFATASSRQVIPTVTQAGQAMLGAAAAAAQMGTTVARQAPTIATAGQAMLGAAAAASQMATQARVAALQAGFLAAASRQTDAMLAGRGILAGVAAHAAFAEAARRTGLQQLYAAAASRQVIPAITNVGVAMHASAAAAITWAAQTRVAGLQAGFVAASSRQIITTVQGAGQAMLAASAGAIALGNAQARVAQLQELFALAASRRVGPAFATAQQAMLGAAAAADTLGAAQRKAEQMQSLFAIAASRKVVPSVQQAGQAMLGAAAAASSMVAAQQRAAQLSELFAAAAARQSAAQVAAQQRVVEMQALFVAASSRQVAATGLAAIAAEALALRMRALAAAQTFLTESSLVLAVRARLVAAALAIQAFASGAATAATGLLTAAMNALGLSSVALGARMAIVSSATTAWTAITTAASGAVTFLTAALRGLLVSFLAFVPVIAAVTAGLYGLWKVFGAFSDAWSAFKAGNLLDHLLKRDDENFIRRFWLSWTGGAKQAAAATDDVAARQERLNLLFNRLSGKQLAKDLGELDQVWQQMQQAGLIGEEQMRAVVDEVRRLDPELRKASPALRALVNEFERLNAVKPDFGGLLAAAGTPVQQLAKARTILAGLTQAVRDNIDAQIKMGTSSNEDIVRGLEGVQGAAGVTTGVVALYRLGLEETTRTTKKFAKESNDLFEQFSGAKGVREARQQIEAMADAGVTFGSLTRDALERAWESFQRLRDQFAAAGRTLPADVAAMGQAIKDQIENPLYQAGAAFVAMRDKAAETKQAIQASLDGLFGKDLEAQAARAAQVLATAFDRVGGDLSVFDGDVLKAEMEKVQAGINAMRRAGAPIPSEWERIVTLVTAHLDRWDDRLQQTRDSIHLVDTTIQEMFEQREKTSQLEERLTATRLQGIDRERYELRLQMEEEIAGLTARGRERERQTEIIRKHYDVLARGLDDKEARERLDRVNHSVQELAEAFRTLAQITDGSMGRIFESLGELLGIMNVVTKAFEGFRAAFRKIGEDGKEKWDFSTLFGSKGLGQAVAGWSQLAATVTTAIGALEQATDVAGRSNRALRGAATGAAIGTQIMPGWGTAIGAGIGALVGALRNPRWEQELRRISKDYGVTVSKEFAKAIEQQAKTEFGGNRDAARLFNLDKIIGEGGGLTVDNFGKMAARLRDTFSLLETGQFDVAQAQSVLDKNFRTFIDFLGGKASPALREIISLNDRLGTQSKEIAEFTSAGARQALEGIGGFITARGQILTALDEARKSLGSADSKKEVAAAREEIAKLQAQLNALPIASQSAASAIGASLFGVMDRLTRNGESLITVMADLAPTITSWQRQLEAAGFTGGAAFDRLRAMAALAGDTVAGPVLQAIEQLTSGLDGMNNADILTPEIYAGITAQVTALVQSLQAQGKTTAEIYPFIAGSLQRIWELQQDFGYQVDASTQAMLDQAEAAGVIGEEHRSVQDRMLKALERTALAVEGLATVFGVTLPSAMETAAQAASDKFGRMTQAARDAIAKIPREIDVRVDYEYEKYTGPQTRGAAAGGSVPAYGLGGHVVSMSEYKAAGGSVARDTAKTRKVSQYLAAGGRVAAAALLAATLTAPVYAAEGKVIPTLHPGAPKGTDTVPAWLTPKEFVQPVQRVEQYTVEGMEALRQGRATIVLDAPALPKATVRAADMKVSAAAHLAAGGRVQTPIAASTSSHMVAQMADGGAVAAYMDHGGSAPPTGSQAASSDLLGLPGLLERIGAAGTRAFAAIRESAITTVTVLRQTREELTGIGLAFETIGAKPLEPQIDLSGLGPFDQFLKDHTDETGAFTGGIAYHGPGPGDISQWQTFTDVIGGASHAIETMPRVRTDADIAAADAEVLRLAQTLGVQLNPALANVGTKITDTFSQIPTELFFTLHTRTAGLSDVVQGISQLPTERPVLVPTTAPGLADVAAGVRAIPPAKFVDVLMPNAAAMAARANGVVAGITSALETIPRSIDIDIRTTQRGSVGIPESATPYPAPPAPPSGGGSFSGPTGGGISSGGSGGFFSLAQRSLGSPGFRFEEWGAGTLVQLHGTEAVIRQQDRMAAAMTWLQAREPRPAASAYGTSGAVTQVTRDQAAAPPAGGGDVHLELNGGIHIHMPPGTRLTPAEAEKHARAILHHLSRGGDNLTLLRRLVATAGDQ